MPDYPLPEKEVMDLLFEGLVIPAHPLALTNQRQFDERRQRALTRYYLDAGAGGLAVGVHSTQFEIREEQYGLFEPVLRLAAEEISRWELSHSRRIVRIAGICGLTPQAVEEAVQARQLGYHAGLLSLGAMGGKSPAEMIRHCRRVAQEIPLFGFYLQPAAGGVILPYAFWRELVEIPNLVGIKVAPFNRYQTMDVMRAVAESGRAEEIALYTGNDDHILLDLLSEFVIPVNGRKVSLHFHGGLLGHWAVWTKKAVEILEMCKQARQKSVIPTELIILANQVTDCNAAFFDAPNQYAGALSGISEVLRRQGLLENALCLSERERLSLGQAEEIERVYRLYPHLNDDEFVHQNLSRWLEG
mgnify:CR=1 FL=1